MLAVVFSVAGPPKQRTGPGNALGHPSGAPFVSKQASGGTPRINILYLASIYFCLSACLSFYPSIHPSIHLSINQSIDRSIYLSIVVGIPIPFRQMNSHWEGTICEAGLKVAVPLLPHTEPPPLVGTAALRGGVPPPGQATCQRKRKK